MALNLARGEDVELVPAWLECDAPEDSWAAVIAHAPGRGRAELVDRAALLGLPAAAVGEVACDDLNPPLLRLGARRAEPPERIKVVDLSALWAGPMCGAIMAAMGADVVKIESAGRPDPTRVSSPAFFRRLNGQKSDLQLDLGTEDGRRRLWAKIAAADLLITSARPRAFPSLGIDPAKLFDANPCLVWVAITGYGWVGEAGARVGFGDDTAAAGGLVRWTESGEPRFAGDALADPVTGLTAAAGALRALGEGGGVLADVAMARAASAAASACKMR
jgi:crotonobetainyl-CoA:carnitine CoA-transferase CaiB-like acyl-CoA transferase